MGEGQQQRGHHQAYADDGEPVAEELLYRVFEEDADDPDGDAAQQDLADIVEVIVFFESEEALAEAGEHRPEDDDRGADGGCMDHDVELQDLIFGEVDT